MTGYHSIYTRFYDEFNQQLIMIETQASESKFMLTRKQKDELIKLLQDEDEGRITVD